ncbi:sushi, von Willebrand factor type A, EGF and pentraxin domain-containing protein 1-like isoform X1 [Panulirus ornatus]|uniref:sushi, von Willebrand factor type A, EGF and pentraxin domain-containing protein 1-like isoform X1 n=1 Tax=Panulirus ornatus TaxID=150431 RepID=UPI003A86D381
MNPTQTIRRTARRPIGFMKFLPALLLAASGLLLMPSTVAVAQYKTERAPFNEFLNYGRKKLKPGRELENEVIKSKVEVLGEILKHHVQRLRQVPNQRIELVFLVDSSASVGAENFFNEIKFVKKLLADFAVSYNQTRVAVITFSSKNKVIRHIDHVTQASENNHKCSLLELELPRIKYSGGGTYTLGAMLEAQSVIALARQDAAKAVFLVTDGYSNGGDPRPAADFLQARGVTIFTFGIRNGNVKELYDMASVPKEEHSYILDSFEEFEALARRALHEDLHSGVLMAQDPRSCLQLCSTGDYCCDAYATCTCGTHTGHYACTCRKGYYGTGLHGDCRPCPAGTYKDKQGPGDVSSCSQCPDIHMMSSTGSTSPQQCYCKRGYNQVGMKCVMLQCPVLAPPENGYFVRNTCNNVVNAACGVRCNPGFTLKGSSIRLCGEDGIWSGGDTQCVMKSCPELKPTAHGTMVCSQPQPTMDTECHFACDPGYQLVGSKMRTCLPVAMWDGIPAYCKPIFCPTLDPLRHGKVRPASCVTSKSKYGTRCEFACDHGYQLSGPIKSTCVDPGVWSGGQKPPRCIDVTPPVIQCPHNQTVTTNQYESFAKISWDPPFVKDNSKEEVRLTTIPATTQPMKLNIGAHTITYVAKDKMGNKASCKFSITVFDEEPPRVDWCDSPPIFLSHDEDVDVYWEEPIFSDNSGKEVQVMRSMEPGQFPQGDTLVEYMAVDEAGNTASCNITITVQKHACQLPVDPINGAANCTENPEAVFCTLTCDDGYAFAMRPRQDYFCAYDGVWLPEDNPMPFPDCSVTSVSNSISQAGEMAMEDDGSICDNIFLMGQVENQLEKKLEEALNTMCDEDVVCEVAAVEAVCESILAEAEEEFNSIDFYRRRRSTKKDPLTYFWPGEDYKTGDSNWVYWKRGEDAATNKMQRVKRDTVLQSFDDFEDKERHKRQFGFSFDDLFGTKATTEAPKQPQKVEDNYLGVLIDLISRSMASDIGLVRFGSFLNTLQSQNGDFTSEDFLSAFAKEFGEDKAEALRELAVKKLSTMKISGLTGTDHARNQSDGQHSVFTHSSGAEEHTWMIGDTGSQSSQSEKSEDFRSNSYNEGSTSYDYDLSHSSQVGNGFTKKAFKVRFRVEGHGSGATDQLQGAMGGLLDAAATGQLDMNFGERQLRVAAIRLKEHPEYLCEAGSIPRNNKCVKCPVGTFFNVVLRDCLPCPQGSFQPEEGQVSCLVCPTNTSTKAGYAKSDQDCKAQCLPGSYSEDGLEPCTTCDLGHYQDEYTSTNCADCPHGTTTWRRGSWVIEECKPKCAAGQVSETGLEPCFDCPIGFFQEGNGQTQCFRCPGGANTHQTGTTSIYECQGVSQGDQAAYTNLQALDINDCFSVPCLNQGSCTPMDFGYVCLCLAGYTGQQCESEVDECESEPCYNNGTCLDMLDNFHCDCPPGFSGSQCEIDINECDPDPCMNGATCVDIVDAFKCICHSGYTGEVCDRDIDECAGTPCAAGATCQDLLNDFACVCPPGDTGRFCEVHINECESSPCAHGLCLDLINEFSCVCEPGYTGKTCEVDVDDCATQPCTNGATCTDWINGFSCTCRPGFTGKLCDTEMPTDFVMEFPSSGILDYVSLEGFKQPLTAASLCFWMHSNDRENYGTPFSYATDDQDNAFTVTDYNGFVVYVNGDKRITDVRGNDGLWHFICVTWASQNGTWAVYLDGGLRDRGSGLAAGSAIEGSGTLVLGQEQDHRGGSYSPQESFIGEMTHVNFWDEVLSQAYIETAFSRCDRYVGTIIGWPDFQAGIKGHVTVKSSTFCHGCGVPSVPPDGSIQQSGSDPGAKVTISCDRGFKLYRGDDERTCLIYGIWSGDEPECRRVSCGFPGYLLNGHVEGNSYSYGDTVSYTCNPGFFLVGYTERTCQSDGEWNGERPQCEVIKCPDLSAGPHGEVMSLLGNYMPTNQISFRCEEGYQMDGPNTLTCGGDGQWDGHPPSCQSETCGELPSITNGYVEGGPLVLPGEQVVVKCDFGYKLVGDALVTCKEDSTWSRPLPKCIKSKCSKPPPVDHGSVKVRASLSSREAVYKCDVGYVLVGSKTLSCGPEGEWDGPWSTCEGLPCPDLQAPSHASITQKDIWRVGDNVTYECELGYKLHGEASRTCVSDGSEGTWQGDTPECRAITCPVPNKLQNGAVSVVNRPPASPDSSDGSLIIFPQTSEEESSDGLFIFPFVESETELRGRRSLHDFPDISFPRVDISDDDHDFPDISFPRVGVSDDDYEAYHDYSDSTGQVSNDYEDFDIFSQSTNQVSKEYEDFGQVSSNYEDFGQSVNSIDDFSLPSNGWDDYSQSSHGLQIFGQSSSDYDLTSQTSESYGGFEQGFQVVEQVDYLYGTEVEYDCRPGFKLLGAYRRRCSERGEWDVPEPRCYEQYCPDLDTLPNAHIIYHGSGVDSRAEYVCDEGFKLVSQDYELLCQSDKTWLGDIPSCQVIDCGEPPEIGNGTVDATNTTFGSLATYNCFFGFVLEGSVNRYCSSLGNWNGSMPRCIAVTCDVPPVIDDGYITFEGSLYVDSPIEYECKECFKLNGTRVRYCQVDGTWTLEEPECNLIYCDDLPTNIPNGRVIGDDNSCGSLVEYECSPGYRLNGKQKATCLENERWSSHAPTCERVSCGLPPSLANGKYIGTSFEFTDKITYECNEGYVLQGPNLQVCQADGTWSDSPPYCAIVNCTKPRGPSNGKVRLSGLFFGSYASIECDPGFKIDGENKLMCDASGNWNVEMPHCLPVICPNAPKPPHTTYNSTELQFDAFTILKYECDVGYYTTTQNTLLMCSTLGEWEGEVVQCLPVDCGDPGTLPNGYISGRDYTYGNAVWFTCNEGFKLLGAGTAECQADGSWSNYATSCLQITCPEPQQFEFGRIVMEDESGVFGASLVYQCNVGYILSGTANRTCDISGVWKGDTPQCQPVTCPEPFEALNSVRVGDVFQYNRSILYSCNEGYSMKGSAELICQADGSWSHEVPICEMITCSEIPKIEHGSWDVKSLGELPIKTEPSTAKAKSELNIFAKLQTLYQGEAKEGLVHKYGDVVEFQCNLGYAMASTGVLECTEDGWNASVPQCHPISCPIPIQIRHGSIIGNDYTFGATIHYKCDEGHELVGEFTRTCQESKEWTDTEPFCRITECPRPAPLDNGQTIGESINYRSILSYICDAGFRLEGDGTRTCQSNGHWTGEQPVCVELFCDLPEEIVHGVRKINSLKVGGTVRYTCMEGYRMEGSPTLNCISEGKWDVAIPKCIQVDCGPPPTGDNIVIQGSHTVYGSQVTFTCERGHQVNGAEWSTCKQSGRWSNDAPLCDPIFCSPPLAPAHGSLLQNEEEEDSSPEAEEEAEFIQLWRGPGHKKKGKKHGKKIKNEGPEKLDRMLEKSYRIDDKVSWVCNEGFQAEGAVSATCTEEGQWSSAPPRCKRVSCGPPELPDYAQIENVDFLYGATANYSCREGYILEGMSILTCEASGDWSSEPPSCVPVSCGPPKPTLHSLIRIITPDHNNPHGFGATASYSCTDGYQLQGGEYQVCEANGEWVGDDHVCLEMLCEDTPALANGLVVKDDAAHPQIATFSCQPGYNLQGNTSVLCSFGRWLEVNTKCEPVNCYEPEVPPFGKITAKHFSLGSVANYSCMYGYMLVGNPSVECDIDATWKGGLPTCQPVDCGSPEAPSHGHVESLFTNLGSEVLYHCDKGYQLFGNDSRVCTSNATWSGNLPQCHRKDCGEIKAPQNGFAMGVGTLYGDRVKFACERGHVLRGEVQVLCEDTGRWSSATPRCEPMICSLPPLPPNAMQQPVRSSLWAFQDRIQYRCQEGYLMRGDLSTTCLETGSWSRVRGQCAKISCGRPKINRDGAVVLGRSFYYKDKVVYHCPPGKVANGSGVLTCTADGSWSGIPACVGQCGRRCLNGGVCLSKNACTCPPGYVGDHCQHAVCVASCLNGGTCVAPYKCRCLLGFVGARCQTPVCEQGCGKGGRCIGPNVCHCSRGHTGPTCDEDDYDYNYYGGQMDNSQDATRFDDWDIVALRRRYRRRH